MTTVAAPRPGSIGAVPAMPSLRVLAPMDTEDLFSRTSGSVVARQRSSSFSALHGSAPSSYNCPTPFSALAHNRNGSAIGGLLDSSSSCLAPESSSSNSNYHHHQTQQQQHQHQQKLRPESLSSIDVNEIHLHEADWQLLYEDVNSMARESLDFSNGNLSFVSENTDCKMEQAMFLPQQPPTAQDNSQSVMPPAGIAGFDDGFMQRPAAPRSAAGFSSASTAAFCSSSMSSSCTSSRTSTPESSHSDSPMSGGASRSTSAESLFYCTAAGSSAAGAGVAMSAPAPFLSPSSAPTYRTAAAAPDTNHQVKSVASQLLTFLAGAVDQEEEMQHQQQAQICPPNAMQLFPAVVQAPPHAAPGVVSAFVDDGNHRATHSPGCHALLAMAPSTLSATSSSSNSSLDEQAAAAIGARGYAQSFGMPSALARNAHPINVSTAASASDSTAMRPAFSQHPLLGDVTGTWSCPTAMQQQQQAHQIAFLPEIASPFSGSQLSATDSAAELSAKSASPTGAGTSEADMLCPPLPILPSIARASFSHRQLVSDSDEDFSPSSCQPPNCSSRRSKSNSAARIRRERLRRNEMEVVALRRENTALRKEEKQLREQVERVRQAVICRMAKEKGLAFNSPGAAPFTGV
ncbi:mucin-19-like [Sycon ciliatum]|uniref:mucin-19-like n=1 Tax=Sycon ciliatum TaxID=27933 RepID=UPI0031F69904